MQKPLTVWITTNCGKLTDTGIPDHLICLLRNLYAGREATVRTQHGMTDRFQIRKGVCQCCILSPWLLNLYAEYIMKNAQVDEAQTAIKISGRNINNLMICRWHQPHGRKWKGAKRPLDESERGEWNIWLKVHIQKMKVMAFGPITSWQIDGETMETGQWQTLFLGGSRTTADSDWSHEIKRLLLLGRRAMINPDSILKSRDITLSTISD